MDRQRRFLAILTALAVAAVVLQALTGSTTLALHLTPVFLIAALLLSGRYVGEEKLIRLLVAFRMRPKRTLHQRRPLERERPLATLLERTPLSERGPPALLAPAA